MVRFAQLALVAVLTVIMENGISKLAGMKRLVGLVLIAALAVFGGASFASAATVTYYTMGNNGTNVASGVTTDYNAGCGNGQGGPVTTLMSQTSNFCGNYEYSNGNVGSTLLEIYADTAYSASTNVTGGTYLVYQYGGGSGGWTGGYQLFYVTSGGTKTNFSGAKVTRDFDGDVTIDLSGQSATVPSGAKLGLRITAEADNGSSNGPLLIWDNYNGRNQGVLTVDETSGCTPDPAPTVGGSLSGNPADLCSVVGAGTNTGTNYKVSGGSGVPDVDPNGTYFEAENYNAIVNNPGSTPSFSTASSISGANGGSYVVSSGGTGVTDPAGQRIDYNVNFTTGGTYYFWVRLNDNPGGNSVFVGVDGVKFGGLTETAAGWFWTQNVQSGTGANNTPISAGAHTLNIWGREDTATDGIYITTSNSTPPGLGGSAGQYTGTIPTGATVIDPASGGSSTLYDAGTCNSVDTTGWTDGTYNLDVTYTDSCGTTGQTTSGTFNFTTCNDTDPATLTTTNPSPASGIVTIQTAVGVETAPATMTGMNVTIAGSSACDVSAAAMTWNAGTSRWEYSWNTSACGTGAPVNGVTIDVSGNDPDCGTLVNAAQVTNVTIDNTCTDATPSSIVIPAGQNVGGTSVDLTALYNTSGNVGSFTYRINGSAVTSPWDSSAFGTSGPELVTFEVTSTDPDCGGTTVGPTSNNITVNNATSTAAGTVSAQPQDSSIVVTAPFTGDTDGNNGVTIKWNTAGGGFTTPLGSQNLGPAASPYSYTVTGLSNGTAYDVQVTYTDAGGVTGTNPQTLTNLIPSNALLHNSSNLGSSYWSPNGWGITGGKYGKFTCATCHTKTTTNIKRIKQTLTAPNGPDQLPIEAAGGSVTFTTTTDASSDFGDDDPALDGGATKRTSSTAICEACHTQTKYHRYDNSAQTIFNHNNKADCVKCHQHNQGFKASCDSCHGNPPTANSAGGPNGLDNSSNGGAGTGSTTYGQHPLHAVTNAYTCDTCHDGYTLTNQMPNNGDINIGFNAFGVTGGSYDGRTAGNGGTYTGAAGTTTSTGGTLNCTNYCHGSTIGGSTTAAKWLDTDTVACGDCHGASDATPPANPASGTSHATHVTTLGLTCSDCHGSGYTSGTTAPAGHTDGQVEWDVTALPKAGAATATYRSVTSGNSGASAPSGAAYGSCANVYCHDPLVVGNHSPQWNIGTTTCTTCHNNGTNDGQLVNAAPATGAHAEHLDSTRPFVTNFIAGQCDECHGVGASTGSHTGHANQALTIGNKLTTYSSTNQNCTNSCHEAPRNGMWNATGTTRCSDCHRPNYIGPTVVWPDNSATGKTTGYGSHLKATTTDNATTSTDWQAQCIKCHPNDHNFTTQSNTVTVPLPPNNWTNAAGTTHVTGNMQNQLGIDYTITGGIHLRYNSQANEANACWNCHGIDSTINEWGYNADTNDIGGTYPATQIKDRNSVSPNSHNYGWVYTTNGYGTKTNAWVDGSGNGYWVQDGYSTATQLQRQIASVHTANVNATGVSSVATAVDGSGQVVAAPAEPPTAIRCSYCHDVHDLNKAVGDVSSGRPFLRGSWMGDPYPPDMPPLAGYTYPTTGGGTGHGNRQYWLKSSSTIVFASSDATPRMFASTGKNKGGFFIDQNSGWPTRGGTAAGTDLTLAQTGGICTLCHGTDVDNMDYYTNSSLWRDATGNGHANSALGGSGRTSGKARNIFDGKRGASSYIFMGLQDEITPTLVGSWGKSFRDGITPQSTAPYNEFSQPGDTSSGTTRMPANLSGWFGGTEGSKFSSSANLNSSVPQYSAWYSGNTNLTDTASIGADGSSRGAQPQRAHSFTCSKCHSPHATGLPALLITNCLDHTIATWQGGSKTAIRANPSNAWVQRTQNNCHKKDGTGSGWNRMNTGQ